MGTCPSSLLVNKAALMLSIEAARYIIRTSPCIGATYTAYLNQLDAAYLSPDTITETIDKEWQNQTTTSPPPKRISSLITTKEEWSKNVSLKYKEHNTRNILGADQNSSGLYSRPIHGLHFPVFTRRAAYECCLLKIDTDMFTYDIQNFKTYDEYKQELNDDKAKDTEKPWLENGHDLIFKNTSGRELADKEAKRIKTLSYFGKLHEIENKVLVKLQECWWKVNAYIIAPFTCMENFGRGSYANIKTEWTNNPYLDINRTFGRDYEASNTGCTQVNQEHTGDPIPEPSNCKVRRFEMMKYSFNDDEEYITIKESEYLNHSKDILDAYRELLRLINEEWVVTTPEG
ncbi:hypothetical protein Tco_0926014 [Tanacetum coccineum]|uniref:Uncharacterized protein n=1 Tax=Tanacetum coccineum TaxID=301880 RepID=A0ABQ5D8I6_9ASTR